MVDKKRLLKWIDDLPKLTELERLKRIPTVKICRKCNSTYPKHLNFCVICLNDKLDILHNSSVIKRIEELEREQEKV